MIFERARTPATLAVALIGFAALRLGGRLEGPWAVFALVCWGLAFWPGRPRLSPRTWLALQVGFLLWMGLGAVLGRHVLDLFGELLVFVQVHRILSRDRAGDDRYVHFIAFGQLLLASVLTVDLAWFVLFCAFAVVTTWALLLGRLAMSAEEDWRDRYGDEGPLPRSVYAGLDGLVGLRFGLAVNVLTLVLLLGTVGLFFVLPRMQVGLFSGGLLQSVHVSGFSDRVRLGEVGTMQLSNEPVMRVRVLDREGEAYPAVPGLYWHGLALDRFDGRAWELSDSRRTTLRLPTHRTVEGPPGRSWELEQRISVEVLDQRILFHLSQAQGIYGAFRNLEATETEGYFVPGPRSRLDYTVYSTPPEFRPDALRAQDPRDAPTALAALHTQLPENLSPRLAALAREWTGGAASPVDALLLLQARLRGDEFTYSLDQPASAYPDPLLAFVDEVREGHCEYFASAFAVMARTLGYPSRVVNGFAGADYNPVGEYWIVRARHAHSWVEVWFPEAGWTRFDPTPSSGATSVAARVSLAARLQGWADYARVSWAAVLLDYEAGSQLEAIRSLARWMEQGGRMELPGADGGVFAETPADRPSWSTDLPWEAGFGLLGLLLLGASGWAIGRYRRLGPARRTLNRVLRSWRRAAKKVDDAPEGTAPTTEWARWAAAHDPRRWASAEPVVRAYEAARFGGGDSRQALEALRSLSRR